MLDPRKIILLDQMDVIINTRLDDKSAFYEMFEKYSCTAEEILNDSIEKGHISFFSIPISYVEKVFLREYFSVPDDIVDEDIIKAVYELMKIESSDAVLNGEEILGNMPLKAVYLKDYFEAISDTAFFIDRVAEYEAKSLMKDEGQIVLDYWKSINAVKDYSSLFPDKPDLKGPPPRKTAEMKTGGIGQLNPI